MGLSVKNFPLQRMFWHGTMNIGQWTDTLGMHEAMISLEGMQDGDKLILQGSIADKPGDGNAYTLRTIEKDSELKIGGYRWYRLSHVDTSGAPIMCHFYGSN